MSITPNSQELTAKLNKHTWTWWETNEDGEDCTQVNQVRHPPWSSNASFEFFTISISATFGLSFGSDEVVQWMRLIVWSVVRKLSWSQRLAGSGLGLSLCSPNSISTSIMTFSLAKGTEMSPPMTSHTLTPWPWFLCHSSDSTWRPDSSNLGYLRGQAYTSCSSTLDDLTLYNIITILILLWSGLEKRRYQPLEKG